MKQTKRDLAAGIRRVSRLSAAVAMFACVLGTGGAQASGAVGEVSLVLGKAWLKRPGSGSELVRVGTTIQASDIIETAGSGHVHIRFIDNELVSVRHYSTLEIIRYDYNPAAPAASAIKLHLEEGVTRAISGEGATEARDNFRMNTPIAAIGVRGTDFVVSADKHNVRAMVNEGAIIVAPFSSQCLAAAFGPCSQGLELAGGVNQIVQISANATDPELLPLAPTGIPAGMLEQTTVPLLATKEREEAETGDLYADSVASRAVNPRIAGTRITPPQVTPPAISAPEFTPDAPVLTAALTSRQMVWGRWVEGDLGNERITVSYASAGADGREGTVGNNLYGLFRTENGSKSVQPGLGVLGFSLNQAQANYRVDGNSSLMDVNGGTLSLDFDQSAYATSLQLNHSATGAINLIDSGRIYAGGYFHNRTPTQVTAGAVSLDGREAGYFFEKILERGSIDGITLWNRTP